MPYVFLVLGIVAFLLGWVVHTGWTASRRGQSEEKAHAFACERRERFPVNSGRPQATIMILGDDDTRIPCRVTRRSANQLRACSERSFPLGMQVRVCFGGDEFVGYVAAEVITRSGHTTRISVLSSTYTGPTFLPEIVRAFLS